MNSKTKTELLAKVREKRTYLSAEEVADALAAIVEVLPDELFADSGKTEKPEAKTES